MNEPDNTNLLGSLQRIFVTRDELDALIDYQRKLYSSLQELNKNHRAIHQHVRDLTEAHNIVREDTNELMHTKHDFSSILRDLAESHQHTSEQVHQAIVSIGYIQEEIRSISKLEDRIERLERERQPRAAQPQHTIYEHGGEEHRT